MDMVEALSAGPYIELCHMPARVWKQTFYKQGWFLFIYFFDQDRVLYR